MLHLFSSHAKVNSSAMTSQVSGDGIGNSQRGSLVVVKVRASRTTTASHRSSCKKQSSGRLNSMLSMAIP